MEDHNGSIGWCTLCPPEGDHNSSNSSSSCSTPFCPTILSYSIHQSSVRVYDLFLLFCSLLFLGFLIIQLAATLKKLYDSMPLFRLLYIMIFVIPIMSCVYEVVSLTTGYQSNSTKVMHVFLRGSILLTELSVVTFGLFIKLCGSSAVKLSSTVAGIVVITVVFTTVQGVLEFMVHTQLPCDDFNFFTHGGMIFLFSTSVIFALAYLIIFLIYILRLYRRWNLPTKKSFYRYALFLSIVNVVQATGSFLWFTGTNHPLAGNSGICLTVIANVIYIVTFAPMVYWIFLSNYFRMNSSLIKQSAEVGSGQINEDPSDAEVMKRKSRSGSSRSSNPLDIGKKRRSLFGDHTSLIAESYDTSGSYGSMDEESFVRQVSPGSTYK